MTKKVKDTRTRIATNKNFIDKSIEYIELHDNGVFFWVAEDLGNIFLRNIETGEVVVERWMPKDERAICSFPVDIDFVKDFFIRLEREFDVSKLPSNCVHYPYENFGVRIDQ
jgi:hypothetical protein